jgi:hypothetical protein
MKNTSHEVQPVLTLSNTVYAISAFKFIISPQTEMAMSLVHPGLLSPSNLVGSFVQRLHEWTTTSTN